MTLNQRIWKEYGGIIPIKKGLRYEGTLIEVIKRLEQRGDLLSQFYDPIRLVIGATQILKKYSQHDKLILCLPLEEPFEVRRGNLLAYSLKMAAIKYALEVYSEEQNPELPLELKIIPEEWKTTRVFHVTGQDNVFASKPEFTEKMAEALHKYFDGEDLLLIPIQNGGLIPGLDVFLNYAALGSKGSVFYPVRMSHKFGDRHPIVTNLEEIALKEAEKGRHVVIFDDISQNGYTLRRFETYMKYLFGETELYSAVMLKRFPEIEAFCISKSEGLKTGLIDLIGSQAARKIMKDIVTFISHPVASPCIHPYAKPY